MPQHVMPWSIMIANACEHDALCVALYTLKIVCICSAPRFSACPAVACPFDKLNSPHSKFRNAPKTLQWWLSRLMVFSRVICWQYAHCTGCASLLWMSGVAPESQRLLLKLLKTPAKASGSLTGSCAPCVQCRLASGSRMLPGIGGETGFLVDST